MIDPSLKKAAGFLARFLGAAVGLFLLWAFLSELYLSSLVAVYNSLGGPAAKFAVHGGSLAVVYSGLQAEPLILQLQGHDVFYMNLLVATGLLLATPSGPWRRRIVWLAGILGVTWLAHLASLGMGTRLVVWDFVDALGAAQAQALGPAVEAAYPRDTEAVARLIFDLWRTWGRPTLALLVWFYVGADFLGLGRETGSVRKGANP